MGRRNGPSGLRKDDDDDLRCGVFGLKNFQVHFLAKSDFRGHKRG